MNFECELRQYGIECQKDEPMARHTTFGIGGGARYFVCPTTEEQLIRALATARACAIRTLVVGRGSNLLISDQGFDGAVISTLMVREIRVLARERQVVAACGASLRELASAAAEAALTGLEFAHGIPGTLGGAVRMNAGAYGGEMAQVVCCVRCYNVLSGEIEKYGGEELAFSHRRSLLTERQELVLLGATLQLNEGERARIVSVMEELRERRRASQPLSYPSAGSVFKRPEGYFAGKLIEDCGLKGYSVGGAQISEKHAGFIVNRGSATAEDVRQLIAYTQQRVLERFNVALEPEIIIM